MFDIGFSELLVVGVVALIVLGPERLPRVARTVGILMGRMQRYVSDVKADINREIELDELRKMRDSVQQAAGEMQSSVEKEFRDAEQTVSAALASPGNPAPALADEEPVVGTAAPAPPAVPEPEPLAAPDPHAPRMPAHASPGAQPDTVPK